jgi:hypothetical protein
MNPTAKNSRPAWGRTWLRIKRPISAALDVVPLTWEEGGTILNWLGATIGYGSPTLPCPPPGQQPDNDISVRKPSLRGGKAAEAIQVLELDCFACGPQ